MPDVRAFLIVCPLVFAAGFIDSIAGGGGLISLPAYLIAGVPVHFALGTNKMSSALGAFVASARYYRNGFVDLFLCLPSAAAALAGSALGARLALLVDGAYLRWFLLAALPIISLYILIKKDFTPKTPPLSRRGTVAASVCISLFAGCYDGFFGPGTGTFLILLYMGLARIESRTATGNAKAVNLASNAGALAVFLINGRVILPLGLAAGVFSIAGSFLGSGLVIRRGAGVLRVFIIIALVLLFARTIQDLRQM